MVPTSIAKRLAIPPLLGLSVAWAGGCGGAPEYEGAKQSAEDIRSARISAYGPKGDAAAVAKKTAGKPFLSGEAAARRGGR